MDHPIVMHLPSKVFCALTDHTGECFYGPKTEAVLSSLVQHWIATTKAAPRPWLSEGEQDDREPVAPPQALPTSSPCAGATSRGYQWKQVGSGPTHAGPD